MKGKLPEPSMVADNLVFTARTEDGGPQGSELRTATANGSMSALEFQTNADGLKFDEQIQNNDSFLKF